MCATKTANGVKCIKAFRKAAEKENSSGVVALVEHAAGKTYGKRTLELKMFQRAVESVGPATFAGKGSWLSCRSQDQYELAVALLTSKKVAKLAAKLPRTFDGNGGSSTEEVDEL